MKSCIVVGASGYSGAVLVKWIQQHPNFNLAALAVSDNSAFAGQGFKQQFPQYGSSVGLNFECLSELQSTDRWHDAEVFFLATPHLLSANLAAELWREGKTVVDLSGAYRLKDSEQFAAAYGFQHPHRELLTEAVYGLPEITSDLLYQAKLVAAAGCYPTSSIIPLTPIVNAFGVSGKPVINAVSGVSGAGRKATLTNTFCEVSLQAYGIEDHRHRPEIEQALATSVVFTPHLASFKQGILNTTTVTLAEAADQQQIQACLATFYQDQPLVNLVDEPPALNHVVDTPMINVAFRLYQDNHTLQLFCALDNLYKGAATQAIQCANLSYGWPTELGLLNPSQEFGLKGA